MNMFIRHQEAYLKFNRWVFENFFSNFADRAPIFRKIRILNRYKLARPEEYRLACAYLRLNECPWWRMLGCGKTDGGIPLYLGLLALQVYACSMEMSEDKGAFAHRRSKAKERRMLALLSAELGTDSRSLRMKFKGRASTREGNIYDNELICREFAKWCEGRWLDFSFAPWDSERMRYARDDGRIYEYIYWVSSMLTNMFWPNDFSCIWSVERKSEMPRDFMRKGLEKCGIFDVPMPRSYACFFPEEVGWCFVPEEILKTGRRDMLMIWKSGVPAIARKVREGGVSEIFSEGPYSWALIPREKQRSIVFFRDGPGVDFRLRGGTSLGRRRWAIGDGPRILCDDVVGEPRSFRCRRVGSDKVLRIGPDGLVGLSVPGEFEVWHKSTPGNVCVEEMEGWGFFRYALSFEIADSRADAGASRPYVRP